MIGFNDMPFIDRLRPPLTTVRFPHYQLGTEAAQLLLERIGERDGPVKILYLAPELVVRGSTAERLGRAVPAGGSGRRRRRARPAAPCSGTPEPPGAPGLTRPPANLRRTTIDCYVKPSYL